MSYWKNGDQEPARIAQVISSGMKNVMPELVTVASRSMAPLQHMIRSDIGSERLGWVSNSPVPVDVPSGSKISPRLRGMLRKSPVLVPTIGWRGATTSRDPDWSWRVEPLRDKREESERPVMARAASLWPDDSSKEFNDIDQPDLNGYHRTAGRHFNQLSRLVHCRQIMFSSNIGVVTFQTRTEKDKNENDVEVMYAIHDLYTVKKDPADLVARPKPQVFTRHEAPLRDLRGEKPKINSNS
jgi:hypothetical protein